MKVILVQLAQILKSVLDGILALGLQLCRLAVPHCKILFTVNSRETHNEMIAGMDKIIQSSIDPFRQASRVAMTAWGGAGRHTYRGRAQPLAEK